MKKFRQILSLIMTVFMLFGCASKASADPFFKAYQKLLDNNTILAQGNLTWNDTKYSIEIGADKKQNVFELVLEKPFDYAFYLKDGYVYIDEMNNQYKVPARDYDLQSFSWNSLNPFLALNQEERKALFDSVTLSGNTYTMIFNPGRLSLLLDDYGAFTIGNARMEATIKEGDLEKVFIEAYARINFGQGVDINMSLELKFQNNGELTLPEDMENWPELNQ